MLPTKVSCSTVEWWLNQENQEKVWISSQWKEWISLLCQVLVLIKMDNSADIAIPKIAPKLTLYSIYVSVQDLWNTVTTFAWKIGSVLDLKLNFQKQRLSCLDPAYLVPLKSCYYNTQDTHPNSKNK